MSTASRTAINDLLSLVNGFRRTQVVYVVAKLGIADYISGSPLTAAELAAKTNSDTESLGRVLRLAALFGLVAEESGGRFSLAPLGEPLISTIQGSIRPVAIQLGELHYGARGALLYSTVTGSSAFQHVYGKPLFEYLAENPDAQKTFDAYMSANKDAFAEALVRKYDFSSVRVIVDVGAGNGSISAAILSKNPELEAIIFDQPQVVSSAHEVLSTAGLHDRCRVVPGDFFQSVPSGGDIYMLSNIVHDWDDIRSVQILSNCRKAMRRDSTLIMLEAILPPHGQPTSAVLADVNMMAMLNGKERAREEYGSLLHMAGLHLSKVVPVSDRLSLIEARPEAT
jgi:O-methyltransferase/methyltransferase family protein